MDHVTIKDQDVSYTNGCLCARENPGIWMARQQGEDHLVTIGIRHSEVQL